MNPNRLKEQATTNLQGVCTGLQNLISGDLIQVPAYAVKEIGLAPDPSE